MVPKLVSALLLTTLAASPALGQEERSSHDEHGKKAVPAAARAIGRTEFALAVSGLTAENAGKVESALARLSITEYECPDCGDVRPAAGRCAACETELEENSVPVFDDVMPSAEKGRITFQVAAGAHVRLSQVEKALRASSVRVPREEAELVAPSVLVFGGGDAEDAALLQKAFRDAGMADAQAYHDARSKEIHVRLEESQPTWSAAAEAGSELAAPLRLTDVIWGRLPMPTRS